MTTTSKRSWHKSATRRATDPYPPLHIEVGISPAYIVVSLLLHLIAAAAMLGSTLHWIVTLTMLAAVALSACLSLQSARSKQHVIWHSTNLIEVTPGTSAESLLGILTDKSFHSTWFVVLALRQNNGRTFRCVIPADSVTQRAYRQLRSRLYLMPRDGFA